MSGAGKSALPAIPFFTLDPPPVLKLVLMDFDIHLHNARLKTILNGCDRLVIYDGSQLFEEVAEQTLGRACVASSKSKR